MKRLFRRMGALVFAVMAWGFFFAPAALAEEKVPEELYEKVYEEAYIRVLVELHPEGGPHIPEGLLSPGMAAEQRADIAAAQTNLLSDLSESDTLTLRQYGTVPMVALDVSIDGLSALEYSPGVVTVHLDRKMKPSLAESVPLIEGDLAHARGFDGAGTVVAILDTGVESDHPFLSGKVVEEACYTNFDCPDGSDTQTGPGSGTPCSDSSAGCYHGTHVAGIAAGSGPNFTGVAPGADIMAIQVFSLEDGYLGAYSSDIIAGLERVYELRDTYNIASINMSLGGSYYTAFCDEASPAMKAVIDNLRSAGIATAIASGNDYLTGAISFPSCISSAVSVGSTTKSDNPSFFTNEADFMSLWAPGSSINSSLLGGTFGLLSGTSMATPHVAGAFALLKQAKPTASVDEMLDAFQKTGKPILNWTKEWTTPRVEVDQAISHLFDKAAITSPTPGTKFMGTGATFTWTTPAGTDAYRLTVGTDVGLSDIFSGGETTAASQAVGGIPANGERVYVRLYSRASGVWVFADYTYNALGIPPLKFFSIRPASGYVDGGTLVTLSGESFVAGSTSVTFGGVSATEVNVISSTSLTAKTPAHATGAVDVAISVPQGTATLAGAYTYTDALGVAKLISPSGTITDRTPTYVWNPVPGATQYRLTSYDFEDMHEAVNQIFTAEEAGCADGVGPCSATPNVALVGLYGHWHIWAGNDAGEGPEAPGMKFGFESSGSGTLPPPDGPFSVTFVSPRAGPRKGGTFITVSGSGFVPGGSILNIGGKAALNVQVIDSNTITATTPWNPAGPADVVVTNSGGSATLTGGYFYGRPSRETVLVSPADGESVNEYRPTFTWRPVPGATMYWLDVWDDYYDSIQEWVNAEEAGCADGVSMCSYIPRKAVAPGWAIYEILSWNSAGFGPIPDLFGLPFFFVEEKQGPFSVKPNKGNIGGGTEVEITGSGFVAGDTQVSFGGTAAASVTVTSPMTLTAVTSAHAEGEVDVVVTVSGTSTTVAGGYVFVPTPDGVKLLSPSGAIYETKPTITWNPTLNAAWYTIWVSDRKGWLFSKFLTAAEAGCEDGNGVCSFKSQVDVHFGDAIVGAQAGNSSGVGPSTDRAGLVKGLNFKVKGPPEAAPTVLSAAALSDTSIRLAWMDNSTTETGFVIERHMGGGTFAEIATAGEDAVAYTDTGLSGATTYTYRVRAVNPAGESADSNTASAATPGVDATEGTENGQITVNWSAESDAVAYNLYRQACATCAKELIASSITGTQYVDTFAQAGVTYIYSLQAIDSAGTVTEVAYTGTGCAQIPTSLSLSNRMFSEPVTIGATNTIVAGTNVTVGRDSRVTFHMRRATGGIRIGSGFRVQSGGSFRALVSTASGSCS